MKFKKILLGTALTVTALGALIAALNYHDAHAPIKNTKDDYWVY
jgi:hypothetical protein